MKCWIVLTLLLSPVVFGRHFLSDEINSYDITESDDGDNDDGDNDNDGDIKKELVNYVMNALSENDKEQDRVEADDFEKHDDDEEPPTNSGGQGSDQDYQDSNHDATPPDNSNGGGEANDGDMASDKTSSILYTLAKDNTVEELDTRVKKLIYGRGDLEKRKEKEEEILSIDEINSSLFSDEDNTAGASPEIIDDKKRLEGKHIGQKPGDILGQGDIMFGPGEEKREFIIENSDSSEDEVEDEVEDATNNKSKYWPGGVVPYIITGPFSAATRKAINDAVAEYKAKTCIKLIPRTNQRNYINFKKLKGCWSYLGFRNQGGQDISIGQGCGYKKTVIHEVMHALGFWHEQARPDRDSHVTINFNNIREKSLWRQFAKKRHAEVDSSGTAYDYYSIMHYSKTAFGKKVGGKKQQTIFPKRRMIKSDFGQCWSCGMSKTDRKQINTIYKCATPTPKPSPSVGVPSYAVLANIIKGQIYKHRTQSNDVFGKTLLNYLRKRYSKYYWTVSVFKPGGNHHFQGYCGQVSKYYGKNVVACYSRISGVSYPTAAKRNQIAGAALAAVNGKGCDAKTAVGRARTKALSYGYPIAVVQVVRFGSGLRSHWHAYTNFHNYVCQRTCKKFWWKSTCTNHKSSLIIMFGKP